MTVDGRRQTVDGERWTVNGQWTLFLDRDGVINHRIPGAYVTGVEEFEFMEGVREAVSYFSGIFGKIIVVTNQQGIGKGLMTEAQLSHVHAHMQVQIKQECRKPNTGMALQAQADFPEINFEKSIMVGDSVTDMEFGLKLGMKTVFIQTKPEDAAAANRLPIDFFCKKLHDVISFISDKPQHNNTTTPKHHQC